MPGLIANIRTKAGVPSSSLVASVKPLELDRAEGVEKFVSTPELQSQGGIGDESLECGQIWTLSPGGQDEHPGLFRLEVNEGLAVARGF